MRALLSVADKTGIVPLATTLAELGWELVATPGTAAPLRDHGLHVVSTADCFGAPRMLDGRVKTLHPLLFAALLARGDRAGHAAELEAGGVVPIDLYAGNFYPFPGRNPGQDTLDSIDIGGPAMMRAAAKNHPWVVPLIDDADYPEVAGLLRDAGGHPSGVGAERRRALAVKVFRTLSGLDTRIAAELAARGALSR